MTYGDGEPMRDYDTEARPGRALPSARVPEYLDRVEKGLMLLAEQVERAEGALAPVLRPERPHPVAGETRDPDRPDQSDLATRIDGMAARASTLGRRLAEVLDRLDL